MPQKTWVVGEEVLAPDFNTYVQNQVIPRFASVAARDAAWPAATALAGAFCVTTDTNTLWQVIGAAWVANGALPGTEIVYAQIIANATIAVAAQAAAQVLINPNQSIAYDGGPVIVEFFAPSGQPAAVAGAQLITTLWDNTTDLGFMTQTINNVAAVFGSALYAKRKITPAAGNHNFHIRAFMNSGGNGTIAAGNTTGYPPAFIRVTRA